MNVDFSGYVTKANTRCTDGRIISAEAFEHANGEVVPLVYEHLHNDPSNVLGKVFLEKRDDGIYGYGCLNNTEKANTVRELLRHGDLDSMSIYATNVVETGNIVRHGKISEVSLVLSGANPGAKIESVTLSHSDGSYTELNDEVVIHHSGIVDVYQSDAVIDIYDDNNNPVNDPDDVGTSFSHADGESNPAPKGKTIQDVWNTLDEEQKRMVYWMIGEATASEGESNEAPKETPKKESNTVKQSNEGGKNMNFNAFETNGPAVQTKTLSHSDIMKVAKTTFDECRNNQTTFKTALAHAAASYGIENIDILFPDAKAIYDKPEFVKRRTEWVNQVISGTKHTPFSRIKSVFADITADEARARGYTKGNKKIEEVFPVMKRVTTPQTVYKKQKLDRDDILDITDFDVVAWLRAEMRVMLDEEIARAILVGDGRLVTSDDKISEEHIRPIWTDDSFYSYKMQLASGTTTDQLADAFVRSRLFYEGAGRPITFMSPETVTDLMLTKDKDGYRMYKTESELADALRVSKIIEVPLFYGLKRTATDNTVEEAANKGKTYALNAIIVNLSDYSIGADKGGQVSMFDDFDIDYNQYRYLIESRISGALTGYRAAVVIETEVASTSGASLASRSRTA